MEIFRQLRIFSFLSFLELSIFYTLLTLTQKKVISIDNFDGTNCSLVSPEETFEELRKISSFFPLERDSSNSFTIYPVEGNFY